MDKVINRPIAIFSYSGRFAHFLKAEASASALSYPVPPRTVLLGVIGAVLGLPKDTPQIELDGSLLALTGGQPQTHWHRAKFRKEIPTPLPRLVKIGMKGSDKPEKATLIKQEWLINPSYQILASLPETYHDDFVKRLKERAWYYSPCLGLSEMNANLEFIAEATASLHREAQSLHCQSIVPQDSVDIDGEKLLEDKLEIQVLRMPRDLSGDRVFTHRDYLIEQRGRPIPVSTSEAWNISTSSLKPFPIMFL